MIQTYRKKPVEIKAVQFTQDTVTDVLTWIVDNGGVVMGGINTQSITQEYSIKTLEGNMKISEGDYIIQGVKGEFYPCKPDIFEATYDKSIDAGTLIADLLTKELEALGDADADLEPREDNGVKELLTEYNKPETRERLTELRDQELVLMTKSEQENPLIVFSAKQEEVIRISKGKFYFKGQEVEDKYEVYERFNDWMSAAQESVALEEARLEGYGEGYQEGVYDAENK